METAEEIISNVLKHHGVKGMKWGVRKDRGHEGEKAKTKQIAKLDKKYERQTRLFSEVYKKGADRLNASMDDFNNQPRWKNAANNGHLLKPDHPEYKAYHKAVAAHIEKTFNEVAKEHGTNASGTKQIRYVYDEKTMIAPHGYLADTKSVKHADDEMRFHVTEVLDKQGFLVSISLTPDVLQQAGDFINNTLAHHGVRGMKWGIRKKPSSVPAGETRAHQKTPGTKVVVEGGHGVRAHDDAMRALSAAKVARNSGVHALSNQELQHLVNRLNLEQQYARLRPPTGKEKATKFVADTLVNVGKQQVSRAVNDYASKQVGDLLKNKK